MRIGTAEADSTFLTQGLALRTVLQTAGVAGPIEIVSSPAGSIDNAKRLHEGAIEFGFMAANWIALAREGHAPFVEPIDLRIVAPMNAGPLYFITRPDADLASVADLRGHKVAVGAKASGMAQHSKVIFEALGWADGEVEKVYLDFGAGAEALEKGAVDAQLQCPLPNKVMRDLTDRMAVKVLPWPVDMLERLLAAAPVYRLTVMPQAVLRGVEHSLTQPAVINVLVTHARVDDALVRDVVMAVVSGAEALERLNPLYAGIRDLFEPLSTWGSAAIEYADVSLHPGALAGYRDCGILAEF